MDYDYHVAEKALELALEYGCYDEDHQLTLKIAKNYYDFLMGNSSHWNKENLKRENTTEETLKRATTEEIKDTMNYYMTDLHGILKKYKECCSKNF